MDGPRPSEGTACELRRQLLSDMMNCDLRRRYLAMRPPELRELDELSQVPSLWKLALLPVIGLGIGAFCGTVSWYNFGFILPWIGVTNPRWIYWFVGITLITIVGFAVSTIQERASVRTIAAELGPLPPDCPDEMEAARKKLLGA